MRRRIITPTEPEPPGVEVGRVKPDAYLAGIRQRDAPVAEKAATIPPLAPARRKIVPFKLGEATKAARAAERVSLHFAVKVSRDDAERWLAYWQPRFGTIIRMITHEGGKPEVIASYTRTSIDPNAEHVELNQPWHALEAKPRDWYMPAPATPAPTVTPEPATTAPAAPTTPLRRRKVTATAPAAPPPVVHRRRLADKVIHVRVAAAAPEGTAPKGEKSAAMLDALLNVEGGLTMKEMGEITGWSPGMKYLTMFAKRSKCTIIDHGNKRYSFQ